MKVVVISSSPFIPKDGQFHAYSPYVKEMAIWARHADEIAFFCPIWKTDKGLLIAPIQFPISKMFIAAEFSITTFRNTLLAFLHSFRNFYLLFKAMAWADHIHLRCPGNIGLMGCIVQIFFPRKPKTAKYAGNWDPDSKQPWSYKLQQFILSNTFLTKNMQVLVYGEWEGSSQNIKPFFTATYHESDKIAVEPRSLNGLVSMIFVGTLSEGKRPLYAVELVEALYKRGINIHLSLYGHGPEKEMLEAYIYEYQLEKQIALKGNFPQDAMKKVYQDAHFVILPSQSEGWPKVVAEGMFWGCLPIATPVSCVANMLGKGNRGILLTMNLKQDADTVFELLQDQQRYTDKVLKGMEWSGKYTLDLFESEIKDLLRS